MSEPKARAKTVTAVVPGVYHWHVPDERIGAESDAHAVVEKGSVVMIDPLPLAPQGENSLRKLGKVEAVCLTGSCHQRSAWRYRKLFGAKVHAPRGAENLEEAPDRWYRAGDELPGGLVAVHTPGPTEVHFGFLRPKGGGIFFCSDVLLNAGKGKLGFVPGEYQDDPEKTRATVARLLDLKFKTICFAHGRPLTRYVSRAIRAALAADSGR